MRFNDVLQRYVIERFLARMTTLPDADSVLLKGALMLRVWGLPRARPTMDIDLLRRGAADPQALKDLVSRCTAIREVNDAVEFDASSLVAEAITEEADDVGTRHASDFARYAHRYLAEVQYRFNRSFDLSSILKRLVAAAAITTAHPERFLRAAEPHILWGIRSVQDAGNGRRGMNVPLEPHTSDRTGTRVPDEQPINRGLVFGIIALSLLMMSVDATIIATVLHALQSGLGTTINWAGWTLTAYSFGFAVMLPVSSRLCERYGRRRVFLCSVVTFTFASLLCGLTDNIFELIALRALQAAGGAGFTPSAVSIIVDHFGSARDRAVSLIGSIFPIGAMIGPIFGGFFVSCWTWRDAFLVNVPIGIVVVILALRFIPRDVPAGKGVLRMDLAGMTLFGCGLLAGMFVITGLSEGSAFMAPTTILVVLAISILSSWAFFRHINRSPHPFIVPGHIYGPHFGPVNLVTMIYSGMTIGAASLIPLYAANRYGIGAVEAGTLLIAQGLATILVSVAIALVLRHTGHRRPIYAGGAAMVAGTALLALQPVAGISPYAWLAGAAFLIGAGSGAINPATRNAGLQLAPAQSSSLAALRSLSLQIGSIAMVSISTAILATAPEPGHAQARIYVAIAALLFAALPAVAHVPEHHGSW